MTVAVAILDHIFQFHFARRSLTTLVFDIRQKSENELFFVATPSLH